MFESVDISSILMWVAVLTVLTVILLDGWYTVEQQHVRFVEMFGKYRRIGKAGFNWKIPVFERVTKPLSMQVMQLDTPVDTISSDKGSVETVISLQFYVGNDDESMFNAKYKLSDARNTIQTNVIDVVRAEVPKLTIDEVFAKKDDIAKAVGVELKHHLESFGYKLDRTMVKSIKLETSVTHAMNEINAAQRQRVAAKERGEAEKIMAVLKAEAEKQSKILQGEGIAGQRKAIAEGLKESVKTIKEALAGGASEADIMNLVLITQGLDTMKDMAMHGKATTIFVPNTAGGLIESMGAQFRNAALAADAAKPNGVDKEHVARN